MEKEISWVKIIFFILSTTASLYLRERAMSLLAGDSNFLLSFDLQLQPRENS